MKKNVITSTRKMVPGSISADENHESLQSSKKKKSATRKLPIPEGFKVVPPKGGFAWTVLAAILLITTMMSVHGTAYSILLQDIIVSMNTSTAMASLGISVTITVSSFIAPLGAMAIHATSCRKTAILGGIVLSLGLILSSFAKNIVTLIVIFGTFTGIGYGLIRISSLVLASHYFDDQYGIAVSTFFTGFSLGRFIFSPLVRIINDEYGFKGTFLLLGGLTLHICVGAALFQPARWHYVLRPILTEDLGENEKNSKDVIDQEKAVEMIEHDRLISQITSNDTITDLEREHENTSLLKKLPANEIVIVQLTNHRKINRAISKSSENVLLDGPLKPTRATTSQDVVAIEANSLIGDDSTNSNGIKERKTRMKIDISWKQKLTGSLDFTLLKESVFYVITATFVLAYLSIIFGTSFFSTLCLDKGLTKMEAAILPTFRAAAEIVGRLTIPLLQSFSNLDPVVFYILTSFITSMALFAQALVEGYYLILLAGLSTGFLSGGIIVQTTTLTLICVGKKNLPSTLGLCTFFKGFFLLLGGPLLGWVRDISGSLTYSYLLITGFQLSCAFIWLVRYFCQSKSKEAIEATQNI